MIRGERRYRLRQTRISAQVWQRLQARITKADIGLAVLQFISQRSAGSKKKERLGRRSPSAAHRKAQSPDVSLQFGCESRLAPAARLSTIRLPRASLPELLQVRLIPPENIAFRLFYVGDTDGVR